jgi:hypothetical protein
MEKVLYFSEQKWIIKIFQKQNSFLEIKYAFIVAMTLNQMQADSRGLIASYMLATN